VQSWLKNSVIVDMDIKNVMKGIIPIQLTVKDKVDRTIKSDSTDADRDAHGKMPSGGEQRQEREPMSDEQMQKCLEHLRSLPGVKDHHFSVELVKEKDKRFVLIKEPGGKVVRRISEAELWTLQVVASEEKKGQILRKTA